MADKKLNVAAIFGLLVAFLWLAGCASHTPRVEDSNHYRAQAYPQGYPCPKCGDLMENINENIRIENKCPKCGEVFFGKPVVKKTQGQGDEGKQGKKIASSGLKSYGPRSVYESDTDYQYFWVGGESFKETETGYSFLYWNFRDSKIKSRRVIPHWTTTRYHYP